MRVSAKADYALRAAIELAGAEGERMIKAARIAEAQQIPRNFLDNILTELRTAGLVRTQRGSDGGSMLARPASTITLADVIRAVEGPLAAVKGVRPDDLEFAGLAAPMGEVWIAVRASLRAVLEATTLEHVVRGELPLAVRQLATGPDAHAPH